MPGDLGRLRHGHPIPAATTYVLEAVDDGLQGRSDIMRRCSRERVE